LDDAELGVQFFLSVFKGSVRIRRWFSVTTTTVDATFGVNVGGHCTVADFE
jgi:hypothetical protein